MGVVLLPPHADPESCATGDKSGAHLAMPAALITARPNGCPFTPSTRGCRLVAAVMPDVIFGFGDRLQPKDKSSV